MKANKVLAMTLAMAMTAGMLAGCGSSEKEVKETKKVEDSASEDHIKLLDLVPE